jgi:predicted membrane chloride channel (bestrophin family)
MGKLNGDVVSASCGSIRVELISTINQKCNINFDLPYWCSGVVLALLLTFSYIMASQRYIMGTVLAVNPSYTLGTKE